MICPICGNKGQQLFSSFECSNNSCKNYVKQNNPCKEISMDFPREYLGEYKPHFTQGGIITHLRQNLDLGPYINSISITTDMFMPNMVDIEIGVIPDLFISRTKDNVDCLFSSCLDEIRPMGIGVRLKIMVI